MSAATPAITALRRAGVDFIERGYTHEPGQEAYGLEAARELGEPPQRVFKTLMVVDSHSPGAMAVGIVPVSSTLNLKNMARAMGVKKVEMAPVEAAERSSGYVAGGISPLGQRRPLPTFIDVSAKEWGAILVSGGRRGIDVELAPADLARLTGARFAQLT